MRKGGGNGGLWKARKTIVPCFPTFPQTLEIARRMHRKMEIMQSDSHIPSAPAASINFISRKDKTRFAYPSPPSGSSLDWKRLDLTCFFTPRRAGRSLSAMSVRSVDLACRSWSDLGVVLLEQKGSPNDLRMAREIIRWQRRVCQAPSCLGHPNDLLGVTWLGTTRWAGSDGGGWRRASSPGKCRRRPWWKAIHMRTGSPRGISSPPAICRVSHLVEA